MPSGRDRSLRWESVPPEFLYLQQAVDLYGELDHCIPFDEVSGRHIRFAERASAEQIADLAAIHAEFCRRKDNEKLIEWLDRREDGRPSERRIASAIRGLLMTFETLAQMGIDPFVAKRILAFPAESPRTMAPSKLPKTLRPFIDLFEKWGEISSDSRRHELLKRAEFQPSELQELKNFHDRLSQIEPATYKGWLQPEGPWSHEQAKVYFTLMLMYTELEIEKR